MAEQNTDTLEVEQTCYECGQIYSVSPSHAEYIHRYGCANCRKRIAVRKELTADGEVNHEH